jgi:Short C-terminal domain
VSLLKPIKDPVEGSMHVVAATQLDAEVLRAPCTITYVIQAPGVEAFSGEQVFEIWSRQWPQPGADLPVVFDREKTDRIEIQWDKVMSTSDSARLHAEELAAQMREGAQPGQATGTGQPGAPVVTPIVIGNASPERIAEAMAKAEQALGMDLDGDGKVGGATGAGAASGAGGAPSPAAAGGDLASQLERLTKLRDSGALTDAEFESMKRKAIG